MLHVGTLFVVLVVFRKDVMGIIEALVGRDFESKEGKLAWFVFIGSLPIGVLGFVFHDFFNSLFDNLFLVAFAFIITGCVLLISEKRLGTRKIYASDSFFIGLAQAIAIIPGISRSGLTVSTGLLRKIDKATVFSFSFLLSVPAILGATVFESRNLVLGNVDIGLIFVGVLVSMIVGYMSLKVLRKIVMSEKFHLFCYYCWTIGLVTFFFAIFQ
jgi:undecaprenyl-diphosphatase